MKVQPGIRGVEIRTAARNALNQDTEVRMDLTPDQAALLIWRIATVLCPELPSDFAGPAARRAAEIDAERRARGTRP